MIKVITNLQTLMILASNVGKARKTGNPNKIKEAQEELRAYEDFVRGSDEMLTNLACGSI
jgi:hypothetical protein